MTNLEPAPLRVLVNDPYPPLCRAIVGILRDRNLLATGMYQLEGALETLRLIADFRPHVLITELGPSPMSGRLTVRRIRDRHPRLPILVHTAAVYAAAALEWETQIRVVPKGARSTTGLLEGLAAVRPGDLELVAYPWSGVGGRR